MSVVSDTYSANLDEVMAICDAPVKPKRKFAKGKKVVPVVVAPVVVEPEVEDEVEPEPEVLEHDDNTEFDESESYIGKCGGTIGIMYDHKRLVARVAELEAQLAEALARPVMEKNENSPDLAEGVHMRLVNGARTKVKYIFPYKADGGVSLVKSMKDGDKCYGVSTTQKNNNKNTCKVADYSLVWLNAKTVKDIKTGVVYPHKNGQFAVVAGETSFNVRMMVLAE